MSSDAVGLERVSRIVGYKIIKGNFQENSPNLPQRVAIFAEANTANQSNLSIAPYNEPYQITSAQQAGVAYGYGSPIYLIARILFPQSGGGIGGIPVVVYPQAEVGGATSKIYHITPSGVATDNGTHTVKVAGRLGVDGGFYDINIVAGDTTADITAKIADAINNILGSPFIAVDFDYETVLTSKWKGLTADGLNVSVETNGNSLGITYSVQSVQSGSGTPSVQAALDLFGNTWVTRVINSYGTITNIMTTLEQFNGIPDPENPTGRFSGIIMKPFIADTGTVADNPSDISDLRLNNCTISFAPAPLSEGLAMEAAANKCLLEAVTSQNTPHLDIAGRAYPDMPTPNAIGSMAEYNNRDLYVKKGCSTVDLVGGQYVFQDSVTTYHPLGENPPQFAYCRNLMLDFNVRFTYYLLEQKYVVDHVIAKDEDTVIATKVIKPKQWRAVLKGEEFAGNLAKRALIVDVPFTQDSIEVNLSTSNPNRLETFFRYKRSGFVRVAATTAEAGFNFGTLN